MRRKCGQKKILNDRDQRSLKCEVKFNGKKSTVELVKLECKRISTCTLKRVLKVWGLKICVASRKSLIRIRREADELMH